MFTLEVLDREGQWVAVRPSGSALPYTYATREGAERALRTFYPDAARIGAARVGERRG